MRRKEALQRLGPAAGAIIAFLAIALVGSLLSPTFPTQRNVTNVMRQTAMLGVVTVGMTFVILTAGIDLSVGMVLSLTSVAAAMLFNNGQGLPLPIVFLATLALGATIGAFNGFMIIWRGAAPFVVTLAMMAIAGGAALTVSGGKPIGGIQGTYAWLGAGSVGPIPVLVLIMLAVFLCWEHSCCATRRTDGRSTPLAVTKKPRAFPALRSVASRWSPTPSAGSCPRWEASSSAPV